MSDAAVTTPAVEKPNKKVVVHILTGKHAGLRKIIGHYIIGEEEVPAVLETADFGRVQHAGTFPRYVLFRQFVTKPSGQFNSFHPEQV